MPEQSQPPAVTAAIEKLKQILGTDRVSVALEPRREHASDASHHHARQPEAVVYPTCVDEVAQIAAVCHEHRVPIVPFGTGTGIEGGVVAVQGGVSIDMRRMNRILRVGETDMDATVEAGVTRYQLNAHLADSDSGLIFRVDPGADASLGGMAATCASGSSTVRYGTMRQNVLSLTVVLADGRVIRTGTRARKSSAGYDLTSLFIGSEGTLGIITELTVRLVRVPEAVSAAVCDFADIESAVAAAIEVMAAGIPMARIELLDEVQIDAVNRYSQLDYKVTPTLFFEFHGSPAGVAEQAERVGEILGRHGGGEFRWATREEERDRLWQARYDAYYASLALREGGVGYVTDVCVPISQLAECIRRAKHELKNTSIPAPLFGHIGDGNFHVVFSIDPDNPAELQEVEDLSRRIVAHALELDGTCTGEHGIGLGKIDALEEEHGESIAVMRSIKNALDPLGIMNPGKVLRTL